MKKAKIETIVISDSEDEERSPAVSGSGAGSGSGATGSSNKSSAKSLRKRVPTTKKPSKRGASTPAAAQPAGLPFPPEVLIKIIAEISCAKESDPTSYQHHVERNALLAPLTRVSRQFQAATYSVLYGDLRVAWEPNTVDLLARSCSQNHALLTLPLRLEATATKGHEHREEWIEEYVENMSYDEERQREYFEERYGDEDAEEYWDGALPDGLMDEYLDDCRDEAEAEWSDDLVTTNWSNRPDIRGMQELLDLMEHTTNLQSLIIRGFALVNPPKHLEGLQSYPSITSLSTPDDYPFVFADLCLAAWLVTRLPRLRRVSGKLTSQVVPATLPPLTHIDLTGTSIPKATLDLLLKPVRNSLVSLRLRGAGWPHFGALPRLERLALEADIAYLDTSSELAVTLPESPLRHLKLPIHYNRHTVVSASILAMLATLPSTLETLLLRCTHRVSEPEEPLQKILEAVKTSQTHPICLLTGLGHGSWLGRDAGIVDKFEAEGVELRILY
ncbi:hypothetical protein RQP46_002740 [Phenoliferia psychrophenolica]